MVISGGLDEMSPTYPCYGLPRLIWDGSLYMGIGLPLKKMYRYEISDLKYEYLGVFNQCLFGI